MKDTTRLFMSLWLAGFAGVLSFQLVDLSALIALLPPPLGGAMPFSFTTLRILAVVQPMVLMTVAIFIGLLLGPKVGLSAPVAASLAQGRPLLPALRPQIVPGIAGGLIGGVALIGCWLLAKPFLPSAFTSRALDFNRLLPPLTRFLYGGITEELLLRWGFMSFLVWAAWKVTQRGAGRPRGHCFAIAIVVSSVAFGVGHLPLAIALAGRASVVLVFYVVAANASFGFVAGYLYWKKGLESAIIAHTMVHVALLTVL